MPSRGSVAWWEARVGRRGESVAKSCMSLACFLCEEVSHSSSQGFPGLPWWAFLIYGLSLVISATAGWGLRILVVRIQRRLNQIPERLPAGERPFPRRLPETMSMGSLSLSTSLPLVSLSPPPPEALTVNFDASHSHVD